MKRRSGHPSAKNLMIINFMFVGVFVAFVFVVALPPCHGDEPGADFPARIAREATDDHDYLEFVQVVADNLIRFGRDHYGSRHTPLFASILDVDTLTCPASMTFYPIDAIRLDPGRYQNRCAPGGGNIMYDQATFRSFHLLSQITGDEKYKAAAVDAIRFALLQGTDSKGFPAMGGHMYWHFYKDAPETQGEYHELWNLPMAWELWWEAHPQTMRRYADLVWDWHVVDQDTGETNRHSDRTPGYAFTYSDASFISLWAFVGEKTGDPRYLKWCRKVAGYHWNRRDPETNFFPSSGGARVRADTSQFTTMQSTLAYHLIVAGDRLSARDLSDKGWAILDAYATYGFDAERESYFGALSRDGKPVNANAKRNPVTGAEQPVGCLAIWQPHAAWQEEPLEMARVYVFAAKRSDSSAMRLAADRFGNMIRRAWKERYAGYPAWGPYREAMGVDPADMKRGSNGVAVLRFANEARANQEVLDHYREGGYMNEAPFGLFADHYGQAIEFALGIYDLTGEKEWLAFAHEVADTAVSELWRDTLFVGHPSKTHYMATDSVGMLLYALLQLQQMENGKQKEVRMCF